MAENLVFVFAKGEDNFSLQTESTEVVCCCHSDGAVFCWCCGCLILKLVRLCGILGRLDDWKHSGSLPYCAVKLAIFSPVKLHGLAGCSGITQ